MSTNEFQQLLMWRIPEMSDKFTVFVERGDKRILCNIWVESIGSWVPAIFFTSKDASEFIEHMKGIYKDGSYNYVVMVGKMDE